MRKTIIQITESDIQENDRFRLNNPIVFVLQRLTGTLWQLDENGFLFEAMRPFRACMLNRQIMNAFWEYRRTGKMEPCEFEVDFCLDMGGADRSTGSLLLDGGRAETAEKREEHVILDRV